MNSDSKILVTGSLAYDQVMKYDGLFKNVLLADKIDNLSIAFMTSNKLIHFGGCAGNIGYTLSLFGVKALISGLAGNDFHDYKTWLNKNNIDTSNIHILPNEYTASASIVTDKNQNQITIFNAGAMLASSDTLSLKDYSNNNIGWVIISPDDPKRMLRLATECRALKVPHIFDPSQQIPNMDTAELEEAIRGSSILIANEYEVELLTKTLNKSKEEIANMCSIYIETHGANGSSVASPEGTFFIKAVPPNAVIDPTGCGDAYRGGVLFGLSLNLPIEKCCQIGALAAAYSLEQAGTQNHAFVIEDFKKRMEENFGESF